MIHAYDSNYLNDAMKNMGEMADYVVNVCGLDLDKFWDMFIASGFATQFESGVPKVICGLSGTELALEVMKKSGLEISLPEAQVVYDYSPDYWCGWILAYYQWYTRRSFKNIRQSLSFVDIKKLYPTLHEASEDKFVDTVDYIIQSKSSVTRLQTLRRLAGYSQKMLALKSGVNLRNIQQYEQRKKNINKAAAINLVAISRVLGCRVEDLLEYENDESKE